MTQYGEHMIQVLKTAMKVLGFTYQDVEKKLGVAPGYLSRLFRGVMELRFDHVVEISEAIGVKPEELLQMAFPPQPRTSSEAIRLVSNRLYQDLVLQEPVPEPGAATAKGRSIEEETEEIERIVLRTFEKFFSSLAKSAAGGQQ